MTAGIPMTLLTASQAGALVGKSGRTVTSLCRRGKLQSAQLKHIPGYTRPRWLVDPDELQTYMKTKWHGRKLRPDSQLNHPPPPGELTALQHQVIAAEPWHQLENIQPDDIHPGAVRVQWSDGESFTIHPNGETDAYRYDETPVPCRSHNINYKTCLEPEPETLNLKP